MLTQYATTPTGLCGNDDRVCQISGLVCLSAMGLYPVNPADGIGVIGSPLVQKAVIRLDPKILWPRRNFHHSRSLPSETDMFPIQP